MKPQLNQAFVTEFAFGSIVRFFWISICFAVTLSPNLASAGCESYLIDKPVDGLYDSIPNASRLEIGDLSLRVIKAFGITQPWDVGFVSVVGSFAHSALAVADRKFSADRTKMMLSSIRTRDQSIRAKHAPAFVLNPGSIELIRGRGIPTSVFLTFHQMRVAGVTYGRLREVLTSEITNQVTAFELRNRASIAEWIKSHPSQVLPVNLLASEILNTSTGRYITTTLTQAGLRITSIVVQGGRLKEIRELVECTGPELLEARQGLGAQDVVPINFMITLKVEPY